MMSISGHPYNTIMVCMMFLQRHKHSYYLLFFPPFISVFLFKAQIIMNVNGVLGGSSSFLTVLTRCNVLLKHMFFCVLLMI